MHPLTRTTRRAVLTGLLLSATALTAPHAVAAGTDPVGRLGPLTGLVVERLRVSDDVAASKYATGSPVDDPAREAQVLRQVREQAAAAGGDPDAAAAFFRDQIAASKTVQKGLLARWTARPAEAPRTQPDLGRTRARLDALTTALLQQLTNTEQERRNPATCAARLALATASGKALLRLDPLHGRALGTATQSVCRPGTPGEPARPHHEPPAAPPRGSGLGTPAPTPLLSPERWRAFPARSVQRPAPSEDARPSHAASRS
ncbi:chorismate mutase [Streptomyces sp. CA-253872]|uniref:chorismate mutase n=1 Tax=Streptomyces sp. CA-253872 TaxID=3240067 RepID=UPI003D945173